LTEPAAERTGESTWGRLRRRKVVQWGIGYVAGAWGFLQGLEFLSETYSWSPQARMLAVPALLLGLPVVLVLAWYHGDRGHQRVTRTEFVILSLLIALGGTAVWRYYESLERATATAAAAQGQAAATSGVQGQATAPAVTPPDDLRPSVAVLPFENRSANADDAYFADGVQDDIVTQLSKLPGLRVIASTSTEKLRGTTLSAREIGQQLGVSKLLQGRVQRAGDRVRINVLLIDTSTESQEWAERYDRSVTGANVLAIQSEVAATVAARLKTGMPESGSVSAETENTRSLQAWEAYQRGQNADTLEEKEQYYRRAIEADPKFVPAYVGLSRVLVRQIYDSGARRDVNLPEAEAAIETALRLDPNSADALVQSAFFAQDGEAEARLRRAIERNPNYAGAYEKLSDLLAESGRFEDALRYAEKGVALDPLSDGLRGSLAGSLAALGRFDEAEVQYRRRVEINPSQPSALHGLAMFEAYVRDRFTVAVPLLEKVRAVAPDLAYFYGDLAQLYMDLEDDARWAEVVDEAVNRWPDRTNVNVMAAALAGHRGDQLSVARYARKILETSPQHPAGIGMLAEADLARGDVAAARDKYAFAYPEFFAPDLPEVDATNADLATDIASILLATGDPARARVLLDRSERALRSLPGLDVSGHDIEYARIYALRGDRAAAVREIREAVKHGWRGPFWRWILLYNRDFTAMRGDPQYQAAVAEIRRDMAEQRAELEKSRQQSPNGGATSEQPGEGTAD
jgi:TolB-like protein/Flp pilus assembly protein TadD